VGRTAFTNLTDSSEIDGDALLQTLAGGWAVLDFPGGARVSMNPVSKLTWVDGEALLQAGSFEIEAPALAYFVYRPAVAPPPGVRSAEAIRRGLDTCQRFLQATQRSRIRFYLGASGEPEFQVIEGDVRAGRALLLPSPAASPASRAPQHEAMPTPLVPFDNYAVHLPVDEIQFVVQSPPGRAWEFEFSASEDFSDILCRVSSPQNTVILPPFAPGRYRWRAARITPEGHRTAFCEPSAFEIAAPGAYSGN